MIPAVSVSGDTFRRPHARSDATADSLSDRISDTVLTDDSSSSPPAIRRSPSWSASTHEVPATPGDDATETATTAVPKDETETQTGSGVPGFGALVAVLALSIVALRAKMAGR